MQVTTFNLLVYIWIGIALAIFPVVLRVVAPYGRHTTTSWGVLINNKLGWMIMESPALLLFAYLFITGKGPHQPVTWIFFTFWMTHYINRTIIFPLRIRTKGKKMPLTIVLMALGFNFVNGTINGYYLGSIADKYTSSWLYNPFFIAGFLLCIFGISLNWISDNKLIHLRKPGQTGYIVPTGGMFNLISCPNHFSEMIEWCGFALMTMSLSGLAFAIWTIVNLIPRALQHHKWYQSTFPDYPVQRKAVIPYLL